jgi:predicted RNase H-like HicB family nuclease
MGKIKVTIEKGAELFGAWADVPGIYGEGETVQETKESIMSAIELYKKYNDVLPEQLQGDVEVLYHIL